MNSEPHGFWLGELIAIVGAFILALVICLTTPTHGGGFIFDGPGGAAVACNTVVDYTAGDNTDTVIGYITSNYYRAFSFTAPADGGGSIKSISLNVWRTGTPAADLTGQICTDNAAKPSATCTSATNTIPYAGLGTTTPGTSQKFSFAGYAYSQSTRYWLVLTSGNVSSSNYYSSRYNSTGTEITASSPSAISWSNSDSSSFGKILVSQCP